MMDILFRAFVGVLWMVVSLPKLAAGVDIATATLITNPNLTPGQQTSVYTVGVLTFSQNPGEKTVHLTGTLKLGQDFTLTNTSIGFHIHETSNFTNGCESAGLHYNPTNQPHGGPMDTKRHVGDLGNVVFDPNTKTAEVHISDTVISLTGSQTIIGRSLVLHKGTDDLGKVGDAESLKTGNAGGRYACGAIVLANNFSPSDAAMSNINAGNGIAMMIVLCMLVINVFK